MPVRNFKPLVFSLSLVLLAGCGEGSGWEMVKYTGVPYTMERTAGTGVAYVRANMLPEKGPIIQSTKTITTIIKPVEQPVPPPAPMPVENAEKVFNESQRK